MVFLTLIPIVVLVVPLAGQASKGQQAEAGWQALRQGDGNSAAIAFDEALKHDPKNPMLHLGAGAAAHLLGQNGDAADSLNRALTLNPRLTPAAELLGEIEYLQGQLDAAIRRYEDALPFAPAVGRPCGNDWTSGGKRPPSTKT